MIVESRDDLYLPVPAHWQVEIPVATVIPNLPLILGSFPAAQLTPAPVDPAAGAPGTGLIQTNGTVQSARSMGDLLRTHYLDAAGARGGPTPQGAPNGFRIISFATHGGAPIWFH